MKKRFFITATGPKIGKTFVTVALVRQAKASGRTVVAYKPIITGFNPAQLQASDTGVLLESMDRRVTPEVIKHISPWSYASPLAPSIAARQENRPIDFQMLAAWSNRVGGGMEDVVLVEGIAGVMTPINDTHTVRDWIQTTQIPALLVAGNYAGTISHALTALAALQQARIPVAAIIVNESENLPESLAATDVRAAELTRLTKVPIVTVKRQNAGDTSQGLSELHKLLA